jgi:hypothetical protein
MKLRRDKLNETHELLVYADDAVLVGYDMNAIKKTQKF